ncbi:MAG: hypothetical protein K2Q45_04235, partial [Nitrosomonas sp.]|nr:hypothetical protein [Nitrosomonas sp.]
YLALRGLYHFFPSASFNSSFCIWLSVNRCFFISEIPLRVYSADIQPNAHTMATEIPRLIRVLGFREENGLKSKNHVTKIARLCEFSGEIS